MSSNTYWHIPKETSPARSVRFCDQTRTSYYFYKKCIEQALLRGSATNKGDMQSTSIIRDSCPFRGFSGHINCSCCRAHAFSFVAHHGRMCCSSDTSCLRQLCRRINPTSIVSDFHQFPKADPLSISRAARWES